MTKVGDVVLVYEEGVKRNLWKMAVVQSLISGKDDQVRGANVKVITKGRAVRLSRPEVISCGSLSGIGRGSCPYRMC